MQRVMGGMLILAMAAASLVVALYGWPVITGQEEIQRWSKVYVSNINVQFVLVVLGSYWVSMQYVTPWVLRRLHLERPAIVVMILRSALNALPAIGVALIMGRSSPLGVL